MIFDYPARATTRRHGPHGYHRYQDYRPWLRDEFEFRCIYCLKRENWEDSLPFEIDHIKPKTRFPELELLYLNLVYSCRTCNQHKRAKPIPDPIQYLNPSTVQVDPIEGELITHDQKTKHIVAALDLNDPEKKRWRRNKIREVENAKQKLISLEASSEDREYYSSLTGFPDDLPNLQEIDLNATKNKRLPGYENFRREGISESWFALREAGDLPDDY